MMRKVGLPALVLVAAMLVSGVACASTAGSTYLDVFGIGVGARPSGLAAYHAAPGDVWSLTYNPAGLANIQRVELAVSAIEWFKDTSYTYLSVGFPRGEGGLALGLAYFDLGSVPVFDDMGSNQAISADAYNFGFIGGYGFDVPNVCDLSAGITGQVIQGSFDDRSGTAIGVNIGVQYAISEEHFQLSGAVKNLGTSFKFAEEEEPQTLTWAFGAAYQTLPDDIQNVDILVTGDLLLPKNRDLAFAGGGEVWIYHMLALRAGYQSGTDFGNFSYGAGFRYSDFQLDYTYTDYKELESTHRISLGMMFGS